MPAYQELPPRTDIFTGMAGFGHFAVANYLKEYLKQDGYSVRVNDVLPRVVNMTYEGPLRGYGHLHTLAYQFSDRHPTMLKGLISPIVFLTRHRIGQQMDSMGQPEIAILTHPFLLQALPTNYQGKTVLFLCEWDQNHRVYFDTGTRQPDRYWVSSSRAYQNALDNGVPDEKIRITGPVLHPKCYDKSLTILSQKEAREKLGLPTEGIHFIVTLGGGRSVKSSIKKLTPLFEIVESLQNQEGCSPIYVNVVCGNNKKTLGFYQKLKETKYPFINPLGWLDWGKGKMLAFYRAADVLVCTNAFSTLIMAEAWTTGVPVLLPANDSLQAQEAQYPKVVQEEGIGTTYSDWANLAKHLAEFVSDPAGWLAQYAPRVSQGIPEEYRQAPTKVRQFVEELFS